MTATTRRPFCWATGCSDPAQVDLDHLCPIHHQARLTGCLVGGCRRWTYATHLCYAHFMESERYNARPDEQTRRRQVDQRPDLKRVRRNLDTLLAAT